MGRRGQELGKDGRRRLEEAKATLRRVGSAVQAGAQLGWEEQQGRMGTRREGRPLAQSYLTGQLLVFLHQLLVFLVHGQHFADPVGGFVSAFVGVGRKAGVRAGYPDPDSSS